MSRTSLAASHPVASVSRPQTPQTQFEAEATPLRQHGHLYNQVTRIRFGYAVVGTAAAVLQMAPT